MFRKTTLALVAFAALAAAGTAARADDITMDTTSFVPMTSRAEVEAEVLRARAAGTLSFTSEVDQSSTMPMMPASGLSRDAVRAAVTGAPRMIDVTINPAA